MSTTDPYGQPRPPADHSPDRYDPTARPPGGPATVDPGPYGGPPARPGRRGPGWAALVGTAVGAALLASGATAAVTTSLRADSRPAAVTTGTGQAAADDGPSREPVDPVVESTGTVPDWVDLAATVGPTVVAIDVRTAAGGGSGSGVVVSADGRIVTNHHVVGGAQRGAIVVTLADGRMFEATIVGTDPPTDLAVIALEDPPDDLQAATLGDSDRVRVGDPVAAIGNPLGLSHTVTTGIVSALDRPVTTGQAESAPGRAASPVTTNAIQVDAPINPGNSGGPLFDAGGRVIGINSSIASMPSVGGAAGSIGLGFAIPSNLVRLITGQLVEDGVAEHAFLGVALGDAVAELGEEVRSGAQVQSVEPGTPAERAGLRPGDVIVRLDDDPVTSAESLIGEIRQHASGDQVVLTVSRDGDAVELEATLATREDRLG